MRIFPVPLYQQKNRPAKPQSFGVNLASPELAYDAKDFFVNIEGYGKNIQWANAVKKVANQAVILIRNGALYDVILHHLANGARAANSALGLKDTDKVKYTGVLRCVREGWVQDKNVEDAEIYTPFGFLGGDKYRIYTQRLSETAKKPLIKPYDKISLSKIITSASGIDNYIYHGEADYINGSLFYTERIYNDIQKNYIKKEVKNKDLSQVNNKIARMRWILAHATPWLRGSDSIANMLMRALYKAMGIKAYPLAENISLDLEAYCTPMEQYMKNFTSFFEHEPVIPK